jgi:hypothetical protein
MQKYLFLLLFPVTCLANEAALTVDSECKGAIPHGAYTVESVSGAVRIAGSYADGLRSGSFTFYDAGGEKLIALPYTGGLIHGTVEAWHVPDEAGGGEPRLKLVSDISAGFIEGRYRTWYDNGKPRSDFTVEEGEIVSAKTWNPDGSVLEIGDPSAFLQTDIETDFAYYSRLEQVMDAFPPVCEPG